MLNRYGLDRCLKISIISLLDVVNPPDAPPNALPNVDVIGAPSIIEELGVYTSWDHENKTDKWMCIYVGSATTWAEIEAGKTDFLTMDKRIIFFDSIQKLLLAGPIALLRLPLGSDELYFGRYNPQA